MRNLTFDYRAIHTGQNGLVDWYAMNVLPVRSES
jgi:ribonucleotide reductase alpha subunit